MAVTEAHDGTPVPGMVTRLVVTKGAADWHDGAGWYYWEEDCADEGSVGSFETKEEAVEHFRGAGVEFEVVGHSTSIGFDLDQCGACEGSGQNKVHRPCRLCRGVGDFLTQARSNERVGGYGRSARSQAERVAVKVKLDDLELLGITPPDLPVTVDLTRVAPAGELDDDNLGGALKSVRDEITEWLGLKSDRDPRVRWLRHQRRGGARNAVEVRIHQGIADCPTCKGPIIP